MFLITTCYIQHSVKIKLIVFVIFDIKTTDMSGKQSDIIMLTRISLL